jgi:hypothetical protein
MVSCQNWRMIPINIIFEKAMRLEYCSTPENTEGVIFFCHEISNMCDNHFTNRGYYAIRNNWRVSFFEVKFIIV